MAGRSSGEGVSVTHGLLMVIIVLVGFIYLTTLLGQLYPVHLVVYIQTDWYFTNASLTLEYRENAHLRQNFEQSTIT